MLKRFYVYNSWKENALLGVLTYDTSIKEFSMKLDDKVNPDKAPYLLRHFMERGIYDMPKEWVLEWVRDRITPPNRQTITYMLEEAGIPMYTEYNLLIFHMGKCTNDGCYIKPCNPNEDLSYEKINLPKDIKVIYD